MSVSSANAGPVLEISFEYCHRLARKTAKNFYYSFLALPGEMRRDMCALYAYMRICDDLGDDPAASVDQRRESLARWREQVLHCLAGEAVDHPALPALADVVSRRGIPRGPLLDVIAGVEMDLEPVRYESFPALKDYCYHVAGAVGLCCIHVWGFEDERALPLAVECGLAFQLTNILRDLREDASLGRVYLPQEDLVRFGYTVADLAACRVDDRFHDLMRFEVSRAQDYYLRSEALVPFVSRTGRPVLVAMRKIYGGLLDEIVRRDYDVFRGRVSLPRWKKLAIVASALLRHR